MLYSKIEDSTLSDFVDDALIWLRSLYTLRKWFEFEEYKIHGIVLTSWLKVFLVLFYENYSAYLKGDRIVRKYYKEWMDSFAHIDVCESDIETIFGYLVINYKEMPKQYLQFDCRDKPILYFNNCYYTFPAVILSSDIINALLFQAKGKNETSKRGDTYEDVTREKWGKILGKVITIEESGPDGQYQCDMAFVFDECLFVCELKNEAQPYSYDEWKRFQVRTEENKEQLGRICDYFRKSANLKIMLGKAPIWTPRKVVSLMLYGCSYGIPERSGNMYVASEQDVFCFFSRIPIAKRKYIPGTNIALEHQYYLPGYSYLEDKQHNLSVSDFEKYMEYPMCLKYHEIATDDMYSESYETIIQWTKLDATD